jgi:hypothetical protein
MARTPNAQRDRALIRQSLRLMRDDIDIVKKFLPDTEPELIGGFLPIF